MTGRKALTMKMGVPGLGTSAVTCPLLLLSTAYMAVMQSAKHPKPNVRKENAASDALHV